VHRDSVASRSARQRTGIYHPEPERGPLAVTLKLPILKLRILKLPQLKVPQVAPHVEQKHSPTVCSERQLAY